MSFTKQAQNSNSIEIAMGGIGFTSPERNVLQTFVGSCIAICIYDTQAKVAGMAHVMLPRNNTSDSRPRPEGKFADIAIPDMIDKLVAKGAKKNRLRAKMAGGANVFQNENKKSVFNIGIRNADAIKEILQENKIPLISEDVGSTAGRFVTFNVESSELTIKERTRGIRTI